MRRANGVLRLIGLILIAILAYGSTTAAQEDEDSCVNVGSCEVCAAIDDGYLCLTTICPGDLKYSCTEIS